MKNMKKILSVILVLILLTATFAVAASAESATHTETPVDADDKTGLSDTDFTTRDSSGQTISVKVNEVQHRYAVDLTFKFEDLTIDSTIIWNVKDMAYDVSETTLADQTRTIKVDNRSDMPVYAYATVADGDDNDGVAVETANNALANAVTVDKATPRTGTTGTAGEGEITINVKSETENWQGVAQYYANKRIGGDTAEKFTLATVTVTISKTK